MENKKVTRKNYFEEIIKAMGGEAMTNVSPDEVIAFAEKEIAAIEHKAEKAKERAAKKREEGDALTEEVFAKLTDEPQLISEIAANFEDEDVTVGKITYRLGKLVREGRAIKTTKAVAGAENGKNHKLSAYAIAG